MFGLLAQSGGSGIGEVDRGCGAAGRTGGALHPK